MTENGIYEAGCGLDNVLISWGHDEYLYMVLKDQSTRECWNAYSPTSDLADLFFSSTYQSPRRLSL